MVSVDKVIGKGLESDCDIVTAEDSESVAGPEESRLRDTVCEVEDIEDSEESVDEPKERHVAAKRRLSTVSADVTERRTKRRK